MKTAGILTISLLIFLLSCKKDSFITSAEARVSISVDTLKYDTVFVSAGSVYQFFKVFNKNNQKLKLSSVKLMGGVNSTYSINIDGTSGPEVNNLEIEANDSLYVFVQVNVNPNASNLPFILRDSIQVSYNGKNRLVQLEAWGQNAHFFRNKEISTDETWNNDLPYVILGSLYIQPGINLTINKGCKIFIHADAPVVNDGSLIVNGLKDTADRVYFQGDRLDEPYKDFPASWPGIYFRSSSKNNVLTYAVIKNAYQAIAAEDSSPNANPKIILNECVIDNAYDAGIIALNSSIQARNCLVSNCGKNIYLAKGGNYQFTHCTVASYSNNFLQHKDPVLYLSNYIKVNNVPVTSNLTATFTNCIFWGESGFVENEVVSDKNSGAVYNVTFNQALWKTTGISPDFTIIAPQPINQPPLFDSINISKNYYDFRLKAGISPAIDKGTNTPVLFDLDGKARSLGPKPDLGCFEKQ